jgi:Fe2+ or Zn2+ uptake regulation protein
MLAGLRAAGFKLTAQRRAIVQLFADDHSHPTAQSIFDRLKLEHPTLSFATVYNTLDALSKAGTSGVLKVGSAARFDPNTEPHHHAICEGCDCIIDLPVDSADPTALDRVRLERDTGFSVRAVETVYRGLCAICVELEQHARS